MSRSQRRLLGVAAVAAGLLAVGCQPAEPPAVLSVGHVDGFAVHVDEGELEVHIHDDEADLERDPATTILHALPGTKVQVPDVPEYSFLGPVGADVWVLPQVQDPDLLWLGWETEEIESGTLQGDQLTWHVTGVNGPGNFSVFTNGPFGEPTVLFDSGDGLPDSAVVPVGTHAHGNWAFTQPGRYVVTFEATATLADGTPVSSGPVPYTFTIDSYECGDVDDLVVPSTGAGGTASVSYTYENCGADPISATVEARVTAPAACGGGVSTHPLGSHTLDAGDSEPGAGSFTVPACAGTYKVQVKGTGPASSFAQQVNLTVS